MVSRKTRGKTSILKLQSVKIGRGLAGNRSSNFCKKVGDAKFPFYYSFVPVFDVLSCEVLPELAESVHLLKSHLQ